ncbi:hypothetical protein C8R47DRAFT_565791 [Mycena vitilis]|nr:hypothetical protein C8R47DRAFT_565791 [Mycena vitilis]
MKRGQSISSFDLHGVSSGCHRCSKDHGRRWGGFHLRCKTLESSLHNPTALAFPLHRAWSARRSVSLTSHLDQSTSTGASLRTYVTFPETRWSAIYGDARCGMSGNQARMPRWVAASRAASSAVFMHNGCRVHLGPEARECGLTASTLAGKGPDVPQVLCEIVLRDTHCQWESRSATEARARDAAATIAVAVQRLSFWAVATRTMAIVTAIC